MDIKHPDSFPITKRLIMCLLGCAMIWYFLKTHRDWVWNYFDSLMAYPKPTPELAAVAQASISAITTIAITGITAVAGIVLFLVTGDVAVLRSFQFASIGQASAGVASQAISENRTEHIFDETARNENLRADEPE